MCEVKARTDRTGKKRTRSRVPVAWHRQAKAMRAENCINELEALIRHEIKKYAPLNKRKGARIGIPVSNIEYRK